MTEAPAFSLGIEEEYLLVDPDTGNLRPAPQGLLDDCRSVLGDRVTPEYLQSQIEVGTSVCTNIAQARTELTELRQVVADKARALGVTPISASCHPFADWRSQHHTSKERYDQQREDMAAVARRMVVCGMHVHIGIEDREQRIDLMNQFTYFLPHLLALSASSPFWRGEDTGLASYRLTVFGNMPRTGFPPRFDSFDDFERNVARLQQLDLLEDASKIWWDLRPSAHFPTIETRICDASPRLEQTLTLAALCQSTLRMLWRLGRQNQQWRLYDNFLLGENRWRAIRHGVTGGLIDFAQGTIRPMPELLDEWIELIAEDADALGCLAEITAARSMLDQGNAAEAQRATDARARAKGQDNHQALRTVVAELAAAFDPDPAEAG
ncbi:carboxylate-amine ligase [Paracoccus jeotgali]|uniref:Putative glutamate--cysteine ligase 2 n=1 Tax=Paracoccus jeotgali TaxID=2065379 RepID=A0A2K9MFI3_9RHOB|nr:carboxylate-amine ligase [Paracoccus jeotgali]AUM74399.1 carboxylate-amine ligase [Paracoccus jeotgali]